MLSFFKKASDTEVNQVKRALGPEAVVVLSASCCMPGTSQLDEQIEAIARRALAQAGLDWPVISLTVTTAQSILPKIASDLDAAEGALAKQVSELFMAHGLSAFPIIIVDQALISYGGVPDQALISGALSKTAETGSGASLEQIQ